MSSKEPTGPYVYQPEPVNSPLYPRIFAVGGPGAEDYDGQRFTRADANRIVEKLRFRVLIGVQPKEKP